MGIFHSYHSKRPASAEREAKKSNVTQYNYKHFRFCTESLEKGNRSVLAAFCHSSDHTRKLLGVIDTSLMDYRNWHTFWFSFEKKKQFQLTGRKHKGKHTAQVLGAATLSLTNSDFGRLTGTWWPHEICMKQSRSWLPSKRQESWTRPLLDRIDAAHWFYVKF